MLFDIRLPEDCIDNSSANIPPDVVYSPSPFRRPAIPTAQAAQLLTQHTFREHTSLSHIDITKLSLKLYKITTSIIEDNNLFVPSSDRQVLHLS